MLDSAKASLAKELGKIERQLSAERKKEDTIKMSIGFHPREPKTVDKWHKIYLKVQELTDAQDRLYRALKCLKKYGEA
jgi:dynactin complex subunit